VGGNSSKKCLTTMFESLINPSERLLDPMERVSEVLFGLIMVLTFTCSLSVAEAGRDEIRTMLIGALGCNLAWGIIDAVFYLMGCFSAQGRGILQLKAVRTLADPSAAHRVIADALPPRVASVLSSAELEDIRQKLNQQPAPPSRPRLGRDQWLAAFGVFLIVFLSTLPVVLPFTFVDPPRSALRISNAVAIALLFLVGYRFGHYAGHRPLGMGFTMVIMGGILVGITISLGG
jgi:VIT1/CCC1 family predicted Fe2+/Mn2+ transporter